MSQLSLILGAFGGLLGVAFGAFGAHALRSRFDDYAMGIFETAVQYQFYHSLALVLLAVLLLQFPSSLLLRYSVVCFSLGIIVFCGSLYALSFTGIKWLGAVTPLGGLAFIAGWLTLLIFAWKSPAS